MTEAPLLESPGAPGTQPADSSAEDALRMLRARTDRDIGKIAGDDKLRAYMLDRFEVELYTGFSSGEDLLDNLKVGSDRYQEACTDLLHILAARGWSQRNLHESIGNTLGGKGLEQEMKHTLELLQKHPEDPAVLLAGCQALSASMLCKDFREVALKQEVWKLMLRLLEKRGEDVAIVSAALPVLQWAGGRSDIGVGEGTAPAFFQMKGGEVVGGVVRSHSGQTRILCFGISVFTRLGDSSARWMRANRFVEEVCLPALAARQDPWALTGYRAIVQVLWFEGHGDLEKLLLDSGMVQQLLDRLEEYASDVFIFEMCCRVLTALMTRLAKEGRQGEIQAAFQPLLRRVALAAPAIATSEDPDTKRFTSEMLACMSVKAAMPLMLQDAAMDGPAASAEFDQILKKASQLKYDWLSVLKDTVLPTQDLFIDTIGLFTYLQEHQYQFLSIIGCSMMFNGICTTIVARACFPIMPKWKLALNVCTFGLYFMLDESRKCSETGQKTFFLHILKTTEAAESLTSFLVGSYSLLIAGFVPGYGPLLLTTTLTRLASIGSSLLLVPLAAYEVTRENVSNGFAGDRVDDYRNYLNSKRSLCGVELPIGIMALFAFQACEIHSQLALLIFQLAARPAGIFVLLVSHLLLWHAFSYCELRRAGQIQDFEWWAHMMFGMLGLAFSMTDSGHGTQIRNRLHVLLRLVALAVAWAFVVQQALTQDDLAEHLRKPFNMALVIVAAAGSIGFPFMVAQQWRAGRWSPPPKPKSAPYQSLPKQSTSRKEASAMTEA